MMIQKKNQPKKPLKVEKPQYITEPINRRTGEFIEERRDKERHQNTAP